MGLQYSRQEWVRLVINGTHHSNFDDVQKIDGDYINAWFPGNDEGYIHKIDDYFEYNTDGTATAASGPTRACCTTRSIRSSPRPTAGTSRSGLTPRTTTGSICSIWRWHLNTPANNSRYTQLIEAQMDPAHFAKVLAIRHAVGDWDSYGYTRGKNNAFYYALPEGKWYLLPWDIDFAFGAGPWRQQQRVRSERASFRR